MIKITKNPLVFPEVDDTQGNEVPKNHLGIKATKNNELQLVTSNGDTKTIVTDMTAITTEQIDDIFESLEA